MSKTQNKSVRTVKTLYHYTDEASIRRIQESKKILASGTDGNKRKAVFGKGVYLTSLRPETPEWKLAKNNYDDNSSFPQEQINAGKLDCLVKVKIPTDDQKLIKEDAGRRDVYRYKGSLHLEDKTHVCLKILKEPDFSDSSEYDSDF